MLLNFAQYRNQTQITCKANIHEDFSWLGQKNISSSAGGNNLLLCAMLGPHSWCVISVIAERNLQPDLSWNDDF